MTTRQAPMTAQRSREPMPQLDLTSEGVDAAWVQVGVEKAISDMESSESWVLDGKVTASGESVDGALVSMAKSLSEAPRSLVSRCVEIAGADIISLMGNIRAGRALLMFRWLAKADGDASTALLRKAAYGGTEMGSVLVQRVTALERRALLARVFSPERFAALLDVLDEIDLGAKD